MPYLAQLDLTRARGLGAAPSRPKGCVYPVTGQLAGPGAYLDWARRTATTLATRAGVRVQNMHPQAWVAHIEGILRNQLGANPWVALQYTKHPGKKADFWWGRALLRELAHHAKRPAPELSAQLTHAVGFMDECVEAVTLPEAEVRDLVMQRQYDSLQSTKNDLDAVAREALTYIEPLERIMLSWQPEIERLVARAEDRSKQLAVVNQAAKLTSLALSLLGTVTAGITELLAVAVELGALAYQTRAQGRLLGSSGVQQLENYGNAMETYADIMDEVDRTVNQADAEWEAADATQLKLERTMSAAPPAPAQAPDAPVPQPMPAPRRRGMGLGVQVGVLLAVLAGAAAVMRRKRRTA